MNIMNQVECTKPKIRVYILCEGVCGLHKTVSVARAILEEGEICRDDGIKLEMSRKCNLDDILLDFATILQQTEKSHTVVHTQHHTKTSDLNLGSNYIDMSLSFIAATVYNKMILNRIRKRWDHVIDLTRMVSSC